jgi:hypothetical protein
MCASLGTRRQIRLKALGAAFERLQQGLHGICEECGEEICFERLEVLPFATNCVDCHTEQKAKVRGTLGAHPWAAPLTESSLRTDLRCRGMRDIIGGNYIFDTLRNMLAAIRERKAS